jgi:hypothetical protein
VNDLLKQKSKTSLLEAKARRTTQLKELGVTGLVVPEITYSDVEAALTQLKKDVDAHYEELTFVHIFIIIKL